MRSHPGAPQRAGRRGHGGRAPPPAAPVLLALLLAVGACGEADEAAPGDGAEAPRSSARAEAPAAADEADRESGNRLDAYLAVRSEPEEVAAALVHVRAGSRHLEAGRTRDAARAFRAARALFPGARDWIDLARALAAAEEGRPASAERLLREVDSDLLDRYGWRVRERALYRAGRPREAAAATMRGTAGRSPAEAGEPLLTAARHFREAGDSAAAREVLKLALARSIPSPRRAEAARMLEEMGALSPPAKLLAARAHASIGAWHRAHPLLREYLDESPGEQAHRDSVTLELGRALHRSGRHHGARRTLGRLARRTDRSPVGTEARYLAAEAAVRSGRVAEGRAELREVAERYPGGPAAGRALQTLARGAEGEGRSEEATRLYLRAAEALPSSEARDAARFRAGILAYLGGETTTAASVLRRARELGSGPVARQRAGYWRAMALRESGRPGAATRLLEAVRAEDPLSYYGILAAREVESPLLPSELSDGGTSDSAPPGPEVRTAVARLGVAESLPFDGAYRFELRRSREHFAAPPEGLRKLAAGLAEGGFPDAAVRVAAALRAEEGRWTLELLRLAYPFPHRGSILAVAAEHGISPYLLAGLIHQESLFRPEATSRAGARGLMQVMPRTGAELARAEGLRAFTSEDLERPDVNLRLGTRYLAQLLRRFDGQVPVALAGYNAGPSRALRWVREYGRDDPVFVESIPFRETRGYVKSVYRKHALYAALYGCGNLEPCFGVAPPASWRGGPEETRGSAVATER